MLFALSYVMTAQHDDTQHVLPVVGRMVDKMNRFCQFIVHDNKMTVLKNLRKVDFQFFGGFKFVASSLINLAQFDKKDIRIGV